MPRTQGERRGRHGALYWTLAETINSYPSPLHSRASSKLLVNWYINSTMLDVYDMLTPNVVIPTGLLSPHIWFKAVGYLAFIEHTAVTGKALPFKAPALLTKSGRNVARVGQPEHPDGAFVAGALILDHNLKVMSVHLWEDDDVDWSALHCPADAPSYEVVPAESCLRVGFAFREL
jgi:hypothetical protein